MKGLTAVAVLVLALLAAGAAFGANAISVTVVKGTHTGGNAQSLATFDGDTLDMTAKAGTTKHVLIFEANYGEQTGDYAHADYVVYVSARSKCTFNGTNTRRFFRAGSYGGTAYLPGDTAVIRVRCHSKEPLETRWERLTLWIGYFG